MCDDVPASGDLVGGQIGDWLVIGWFTEDSTYRPLAEAFGANLSQHGAPFHLFAKPSLGAWNTRWKPAVVLEAMDAYPGKTLVLMDVAVCGARMCSFGLILSAGPVNFTLVRAGSEASRFERL